MTQVQLSGEQQRALEILVRAGRGRLRGYAGTGKTTVIAALMEELPEYGVCAYTGKAAHVLRRKGVTEATTIHSRIYRVKEVVWEDERGKWKTKLVSYAKGLEELD
jgi:exodeoxyribonuclease-5